MSRIWMKSRFGCYFFVKATRILAKEDDKAAVDIFFKKASIQNYVVLSGVKSACVLFGLLALSGTDECSQFLWVGSSILGRSSVGCALDQNSASVHALLMQHMSLSKRKNPKSTIQPCSASLEAQISIFHPKFRTRYTIVRS